MADEQNARPNWLERRRARKRLKRERTGDSPEKLAHHHAPRGDSVDLMLKAGGVERESAFKRDKQ
jgi:hypothetical protein